MTEPVRRAQEGLKSLVARVNSEKELVLNVGIEQGVRPGDIFRIMSTEGIPINDPESGEQLGVVPVEKARVKARTVYQKICIVETYRTYTIGGSHSSVAAIFGPERTVTEKMEVEESDEYEIDKTVRVGDAATLFTLAK